MAILPVYRQVLKVQSIDQLCGLFVKTLLKTNRTHAFFVDWQKVKENVDRLNFEVSILNALCGSPDVEKDLRKAIQRHSEVIAVFPIILAVRAAKLSVLDESTKPVPDVLEYDFGPRENISADETEKIISFCRKTGIIDLFSGLRLCSLRDYLIGVEVGMDTNAKKSQRYLDGETS